MNLEGNIEFVHSSVSIFSNNSIICGGAVLNSYIILTAATCLYGISEFELRVVEVVSQQRRNVSKIIIHENYDISSVHSNIALAILSDSFTLDEKFKPIKYQKHRHKFGGDVFIAQNDIGIPTYHKLEAQLWFCDLDDKEYEGIICVNTYSCSGILPGIPMICEHGGRHVVCGLKIYIPSYCLSTMYFTDVSLFGPWIENTIKKETVSKCKQGEFYCVQEEKCINAINKCNGIIDCSMFDEDEKYCFTASITTITATEMETSKIKCRVNEFSCETGAHMCILNHQKCDGNLDCENGEDEAHCPAITPEPCFRDSSKTFRCLNGKCIPPDFICDNDPDCPNHDDETQCEEINLYKLKNCTDNEYLCKRDSKCIPKTSVCDRIVDCPFKDDEFKCPHECGVGQFSCVLGKCVSKYEECVAQYDCPDGDVAACPNGCPLDKFSCNNASSNNTQVDCVPLHYRCDGGNDCLNAEDERNCTTFEACTSIEFKCSIGNCLPMYFKCDGQNDCQNGEDEVGCHLNETTTQASITCQEFRCDSGKCIPNRYLCDSDPDCPNGEDERNCTVTTPSSGECDSSEFRCNNSYCIPLRYKCDNDDDCSEGEDELGCPVRTTLTNCKSSEFSCRSGKCIPRQFKCDGESDCAENEDEPDDCPYKAVTMQQIFPPVDKSCPNTHYQCINGVCNPSKFNCNGVPNCALGDDETFCEQPKTNCSIDSYRCLNGKCIPLIFRCDGERDCYQGDDEHKCPQVTPGRALYCDKACRRRDLVNTFNEAVSRCCITHGNNNGHCEVGHFARCF